MKSGIWANNQFDNIPNKSRLSLGEGDTPVTQVNLSNLDQPVYLKLEDKNPHKSFKDRSLAYQLSYHINQGIRKFVISSSGNAAISAAAYSALAGVELDIYVANKVNSVKFDILQKYESNSIRIHKSSKPKSEAMKYSARNDAFNLRGSQDPHATTGFQSIAYELAKQAADTDAIFIPCSSGTSTVGIHQGFKDVGMNVAIHICQTTRINPMAKEFDKTFEATSTSLADAISDRVAHRKDQVASIIRSTNGFGWVISDLEINEASAQIPLVEYGFTPNSLLAVAGLIKAYKNNMIYNKPTLLISGI